MTVQKWQTEISVENVENEIKMSGMSIFGFQFHHKLLSGSYQSSYLQNDLIMIDSEGKTYTFKINLIILENRTGCIYIFYWAATNTEF